MKTLRGKRRIVSVKRKKAERLLKGSAWMVLWLLLIVMTSASADAEETIKIGEVVVTATRYEEQLADVPANVSVITEERIKNSNAPNIPELLRTEPGIHVSDIAGNGRNYTVDVRGFG